MNRIKIGKPKRRTIVVFSIAFLIGVMATLLFVQAQAPTNVFTWSGGVYPGAPSVTVYSETVGAVTTYYAKNQYGASLYSNTDASDVINSAITNYLTFGRTWKETVVIKGDITSLTNTIILPSYCKIDGQNSLITWTGGKTDCFYATGKTDIELCNLKLDGNGNAFTAGSEIVGGFSFSSCKNIYVHDCESYNVGGSKIYGFGFSFISCSNITTEHLSGWGCGSHTFAFNNVTNLQGNFLTAENDSLVDPYSGLWITGHNVRMSNIQCKNEGFGVHLEGFNQDSSDYVLNNICLDNIHHIGLFIACWANYKINDVHVSNLIITNSDNTAVEVWAQDNTTVSNIFVNQFSITNTTYYHPIYVQTSGLNPTLYNVHFSYGHVNGANNSYGFNTFNYTNGIMRGIYLDHIDFENTYYDGVAMRWVDQFAVESCTFKNCSYSGLYSAPAIRVYGSTNGTVTNCFSRAGEYGILEQNTSDYNTYLNNKAFDASVSGITICGANSRVNLCQNGTSWVP